MCSFPLTNSSSFVIVLWVKQSYDLLKAPFSNIFPEFHLFPRFFSRFGPSFPWHFPKAFARTTRPRPAHWSPWPSPLACRARGGTLVLGVFTHRGTIFLTKDGENIVVLGYKTWGFRFRLSLMMFDSILWMLVAGWSFYNAMKHGEHVSFYIIYTLYINIIAVSRWFYHQTWWTGVNLPWNIGDLSPL